MATALDVANYILAVNPDDDEELISNLKLQKLLYYIQGFSYVLLGKPMFPESLKRWDHGPVVPQVYHEFKHYGNQGILAPDTFDLEILEDDERELIDEVLCMYGQYSAMGLRNMTHDETPWLETNPNETIDPELMKDFFQTLVHDGEAE